MFYKFQSFANESTPGVTVPPTVAALASQDADAPVVAEKRKFKIDDTEVDEDTLINSYKERDKHNKAAQAKFREASELRKKADDIVAAASTDKDALKALERSGLSREEAKKALEDSLRRIYEEEDQPELAEKRKLEQERDELKKYKEEIEKKKQEEEMSREEATAFEALDNELAEAFQSSDLPVHPILSKFALQYMAAYADKDVDLDPSEAVDMVKRDFPVLMQDMVQKMSVEQLKSFIGKETLSKLRDDAVSAVKKAEAPFTKAAPVAPVKQDSQSNPTEDGPKVMRSKDFFRNKRGF